MMRSVIFIGAEAQLRLPSLQQLTALLIAWQGLDPVQISGGSILLHQYIN